MRSLHEATARIRRLFQGSDSAIGDSSSLTEATPDHPLAHADYLYTPEHAPYFTHRSLFRPLSIQVETVNICNNDCIFCPYSMQDRKKEIMSLETFERVVRGYEEIGGGQIGLTPMVGELFLDKLLLKRLRLIAKSSLISSVSAVTNASMVARIEESILEEALSYFEGVTVSIYGLDEEEYFTITRKRSYHRMVEGIVRLIKIAGPRKVVLHTRQIKKRDPQVIDNWLSNIAELSGRTRSEIRANWGITNYSNWSVFDKETKLPYDAQWIDRQPYEGQCALPLASMQVYSNGNVSFCGCADFNGDGELQVGNINESSFRAILESDRYRQLWKWDKMGIPKFCQSCSFYRPLTLFRDTPAAVSDPLGILNGYR